MARARTQRTLAAAGLSLVTGTAAIGLAVVGVGPLGQVAASVRDTGAAMSRGVLSVVMPDQEQEAAPAERAGRDGGSSTAPAARRAAGPPVGADTTPADDGDTAEPSDTGLPDASAVADQPEVGGLVDSLSQGVSPSAQASGDSGPGDGIVEDLVGGLLGQGGDLTSGVLR